MLNTRVLHLIPHLGGGVGSVITAWMRNAAIEEQHSIICFDKNKNNDWESLTPPHGAVHIIDGASALPNFSEVVRQAIVSADIVVLHWWNHPQIFDLMVNFDWPICRLIIWNHVSGLFAPYVLTEDTINFCDFFVNTSPISFKNTAFDRATTECDTIWSTVDISNFSDLTRTLHDNFIVGYTGTVDVGKLHRDYIKISSPAICDGIHFIVCSGDSQQRLESDALRCGVSASFSFMGRVPSVLPFLSQYDVFGYPLQGTHFGTCEQSLGEAMMAGCVPVVLDNPSESFIVEHEKSGLVAKSPEEYSECLLRLFYNKPLLHFLSRNAQNRAKKLYDLHKTLNKWQIVFEKMMRQPKRLRKYNSGPCHSPAELYSISLGGFSGALLDYMNAKTAVDKEKSKEKIKTLFSSNPMFSSSNKGSVLQYLQFFPNDKILADWASLLNGD